ncbi:RagB/SusD family nutrient uptake outer membrane protein [Segetibacter sp. 3557_3]|uniref:RagB/SusD family nutrient uptake outer membrane protein n=1 Tax=Segetibacter sp. 3557_3 TaxID=2547429 RepID=UPI001058BF28|nr:RagB/SusD family nutrient uptake outer membrane protein [Segetibacter sp. 3557_3]TDH24257.1 RagB/SusD family nutrient uptake outer membrane protein [Segetibacter sp. 3557_3]
MRLLKYSLILVLIVTSASSCKKLLDTEPRDVLQEQQMYRDVFDADAAVTGLYGQFLGLAERTVVLNELRADLATTTMNADQYLRQLNEHNVQADNPYADVRPYYQVILNCNDILHNFDLMLRDKKLKTQDYTMRYSDVAALRTWIYLQLGVQFGKVPYITQPLSRTFDINQVRTFPKIEFNQLIDSLVARMESLPYQQPYAPTASLVTTVDGYGTDRFFVPKKVVMAELYLWKGSYLKAAAAFKEVMETGAGELFNYRITGASKADNNDIAVGYVRYREEDENMLVDNNNQGWRSIFARGQDRLFNYEWVWYLPYDINFKPQNPFVNLFSNKGGAYLVKPSQSAINNWNSQVQKNDFPYDARGRVFSYRTINGEPVIMKYLYNYLNGSNFTPINPLEKSGKWFLYRAASLHLGFAEAANRNNHSYLAYTLVNQGLTTIPGRITNEGFPYNFDARRSDVPRIVGDWSSNSGIRGRANLYSQTITGDSTTAIEDGIINEAGLELAYEGRRWYDLVRIALRRNDPSFLANKVYDKLKLENNLAAEAVRAKLMNKDNWYLPFN